MIFCTKCGVSLQDAHLFCWNCGTKSESWQPVPARPNPGLPFADVPPRTPRVSRGFGQMFGLDPRVAFLTLIVDMMLNAGDVMSMGLLVPVSAMAGLVLGYIVYKAQMNWYGDDKETAKLKAIILGLLTAIPTPLPELLYVPAGLVGLWQGFRRKVSHS